MASEVRLASTLRYLAGSMVNDSDFDPELKLVAHTRTTLCFWYSALAPERPAGVWMRAMAVAITFFSLCLGWQSIAPSAFWCGVGAFFWRPLEVHMDRRSTLVAAAMRLHNYCNDRRIGIDLREVPARPRSSRVCGRQARTSVRTASLLTFSTPWTTTLLPTWTDARGETSSSAASKTRGLNTPASPCKKLLDRPSAGSPRGRPGRRRRLPRSSAAGCPSW